MIFSKHLKILLITVTLATTGFLVNDAFAASGISSAVANDPDDADAVYSVGDTITITFPAQVNSTFASGTMTNAEFRANFTVNPSDIDTADTLTGVWNAGATAITLTINTITGVTPPIIGTDTFEYDPASGNIHYQGNGTEFTGTSVTLTGDFGLFVALNTGSGGCRGDCTEPTLGLDKNGIRLVENGFIYNGKPVDVERFFTPYPLITVNVGAQNLAEFKIYENGGSDNVSHFDLAFGLANGQILSQSKAMIEWDRTFDGTESINVIDPDNLLSDDVNVLTSEGKCKQDSVVDDCLIVKVYHKFRAPPEFNIVGTNVWDSDRNSWQNYYNHGIEVVGKSMNPPKQYLVLDKGNLVTITEVENNHAVDEERNHWFFDKEWIKEYVPQGKIIDPISKYHGIDRNHAYFETYLEGQKLIASNTLDQLLGGKSIQDESPEKSFSYDYKWVLRSDDVVLQKNIKLEMLKAQQLYETMYHMKNP